MIHQPPKKRALLTCSTNESKVKIIITTDSNGKELSYIVKDADNQKVAEGSSFDNSATVTETVCLKQGQYTFRLKDSGGDGICAQGSCGNILISVDGTTVTKIQPTNSFSVIDQKFDVTMFSGRGSLTGSSSSETFSGDSGFVSKSCYDTQVYLKIDKFGKETSFKITKNGNTIFEDEKSLDSYEDNTFDIGCLQPGDYTLTVTDIDGLCCRNGEGEFKLIVDGVDLFSGGRFTGSDSHDFKIGYDWGQGMQSRDWEYLLAHNERRQDYHTRCNDRYCNKKYRPLKWSTGLAADAQVYANSLLDSCDDTGIVHETGIEQGENLAKNKGFGEWGQLYPADKIVKRFVDNEAEWSWTHNAHLTQALWYATRYLGCAESVKTMNDGSTCRMQVCRYAKAGNCEMGKYDSHTWPNHEIPMMMDDSQCGPVCPPEGCYI
jgi:hypothetical protein